MSEISPERLARIQEMERREIASQADEAMTYMERDRMTADRAITEVFRQTGILQMPKAAQESKRAKILAEIARRKDEQQSAAK